MGKRESAERDEGSSEPKSPEWSESSARPSRKKGKKRSKDERSDSGGGRSRKRSEEKKGKKKESRSLDPSDLRNSLSSSSAFVKRTLANALRDSASPSGKKRSTRSVEISYREEEENEDSSSFFHVRGKRKVERVVELDTESFDRTNPFSNARSRGGRGS